FDAILFFFFQAEDGIRDFHVTGVQTCALPIWLAHAAIGLVFYFYVGDFDRAPDSSEKERSTSVDPVDGAFAKYSTSHAKNESKRSEERRVGKECRYWRWA